MVLRAGDVRSGAAYMQFSLLTVQGPMKVVKHRARMMRYHQAYFVDVWDE